MRQILNLFFVLCLCLAGSACSAGKAGELLTSHPEPKAAPAFDLETPDGSRVRLSDFHGKPLIVNFWATWCPPCRAEMPSFQRAWEQLKAEGIGVIAINVGEDAQTIEAFTDEVPVSFPLPMDIASQVVPTWPIRGLPTTFVVDPEGKIAYSATGEREWDDPKILEMVRALAND